MKELPILFSAPMVRAILDGRKSQTRRIVKPQPQQVGFSRNCAVKPYCTGTDWPLAYYEMRGACWNSSKPLHCPFGQPGDQLWVKETFCCKMDSGEFVYRPDGHHDCYYRATETNNIIKDDGDGGTEYRADGSEASPWTPSIFMPRWASRLTLEIVSVRVERLQEITEEDANLEGIDAPRCPRCGYTRFDCSFHGDHRLCPHDTPASAIPVYGKLWDSTYAKTHPWASNPWVWVIECRRITK